LNTPALLWSYPFPIDRLLILLYLVGYSGGLTAIARKEIISTRRQLEHRSERRDLRHAILFLAAALGFLPTSFASPVYGVAADGDLYTITLAAGISPTTEVGSMGEVMTDIAGYDGSLYGIGINGDLYSISPSSGHATEIGPTDEFGITALEFDPANGILNAGDAGPIESDPPFSTNTSTGEMNLAIDKLLHPDILGLAWVNGILYGFSVDGEIVTINLKSRTANSFATYSPGFYGVTTLDPPLASPDPAPEPGTFGIAGVVTLGLAIRRAVSRVEALAPIEEGLSSTGTQVPKPEDLLL